MTDPLHLLRELAARWREEAALYARWGHDARAAAAESYAAELEAALGEQGTGHVQQGEDGPQLVIRITAEELSVLRFVAAHHRKLDTPEKLVRAMLDEALEEAAVLRAKLLWAFTRSGAGGGTA